MNSSIKRNFIGILLLLLTILPACATQTSNPSLRRKAASISLILPDEKSIDTNRKYTIISEVEGVSCGRQLGSGPSLDVAREMLRIEAAKVDADAVLNIACEETGVSWTHNCWKTIECRGDAVKWMSK